MSEFTVDDLVNFAVQSDSVNLRRALDDIMDSKIDGAIEARREKVGIALFGDQEPELEDENTGDDYSDEDNLDDIEEEKPDETDE